MSVSIKPPGSPGAIGVQGPSEAQPSGVAGPTGASATSGVAPSAASEAASPSAAILSKLDAGEITREQAIDGMVSQAMSALGAARLPPAQRSELESVLRAALAEDPTLNQLMG